MFAFFSLIALLLDVAAVVDMVGRQRPDSDKIVWIVIVLFIPILGAVVYFAVGRRSMGR